MENKRKASGATNHEAGSDTPDRAAKRRKLQEVRSHAPPLLFPPYIHSPAIHLVWKFVCVPSAKDALEARAGVGAIMTAEAIEG